MEGDQNKGVLTRGKNTLVAVFAKNRNLETVCDRPRETV